MTSPKRLSIIRPGHIKWILLSLFVGLGIILIWPDVSTDEADIFVPIIIGKRPSGLTIAGPQVKGLEIRVRGPRAVIKTLSDLKLEYVLNLTGISSGVQSVPVQTALIPVPKGISIIGSKPSMLTVTIENEIKKELPIVISFAGEPATGFLITDAVAKPATVILCGPESILSALKKIMTKPIDINGLSESFKKELALDLAERLEVVSSSSIIMTDVLIEEKIATKKFKGVSVNGKDSPYGFRITPPVIDIEVKGPVNILEKLEPQRDIKVYVDLKGLRPGVYVRRAAIRLPVKTTLFGVKPEIFIVKITDR
ncbi:YbbR-like domain-containing protein [Thermodesulfobacteriota bacterium]